MNHAINLTVGCHYFVPGLWLPPQLSPDGATYKRPHTSDSSLLLIYRPRKNERCKIFLQELGMELIRPQLAARASNPVGLHMSTHCALLTALNDEHTESSSSEPSIHNRETSSTAQRGRCHVCSKEFAGTGDSKKKKSNRANKTRHRCVQCNQWACSKHASVETHTQYFCNKCK